MFDKQGNRTSLTDAPATGACSSAGGATTTWAHDVFSRQLTGANGSGTYVYDAFGRQTTLPSTDAPNSAAGNITIGYYDTDAVASMSQGTSPAVTESFTLDPAGRRLQQQTSDGTTTTTVNSHYGNSSDNPTWATQISGSTTATTRYLGALAGGLSATSTTQGSTTTSSLTLVDPGGSIVATVDIPATGNADSITGYATTDEYGAAASYVDTGVLQYGWLGSKQRTVTGTGLTLMGARVYNPGSGRFTSVDPITGGNESAYNYPDDPINSEDSSGLWSYSGSYSVGYSNKSASAIVAYIYAHFSKLLPFRGAPKILTLGAQFTLLVKGVIPFPLTVATMDASSWRFKTRGGHPDHPGAITFTISHNKNNKYSLVVHAVIGDSSPVSIGMKLGCMTTGFLLEVCIAAARQIYVSQAGEGWTQFAKNINAVLPKI